MSGLPRKPFIILCTRRTGSTHLQNLLEQHPDIDQYSEVLCDLREHRWPVRGSVALDDGDGADFLRYLYEGEPRPQHATGFKLMYHQARTGGLASAWDYLAQRPDLLVIHLTRENLLEMLASDTLAGGTGIWNIDRESNRPNHGRVELEASACRQYFERIGKERDWALRRLAGARVLPVSYEHLCSDPQQVVDAICDELGVSRFTPELRILKIETLAMRDRVANYEALKSHFMGSEFARYFP